MQIHFRRVALKANVEVPRSTFAKLVKVIGAFTAGPDYKIESEGPEDRYLDL